jgi:hypothetical protein
MMSVEWKQYSQTIKIPHPSIEFRIAAHLFNKPNNAFYKAVGMMYVYERKMEQWEEIMGRLRWERAVLRTD